MQITPVVLDEVRRLTAEVLQIEIEEISAEALFFADLGGESLDLLELKFRLEKQFQVRVPFHDLTVNAIELDEQGCLTASSLAVLKSKFPFLKLDDFEARPLERKTDLLTIEALAGFVQTAVNLRQTAAPATAAVQSS
jgi:acyl carrier protein